MQIMMIGENRESDLQIQYRNILQDLGGASALDWKGRSPGKKGYYVRREQLLVFLEGNSIMHPKANIAVYSIRVILFTVQKVSSNCGNTKRMNEKLIYYYVHQILSLFLQIVTLWLGYLSRRQNALEAGAIFMYANPVLLM